MYALKIQKIGESFGIVLPEQVLKQLNVKEGDSLCLLETADGIKIEPCDPNFEKALKAYKKGSEKYKNALRELAQ